MDEILAKMTEQGHAVLYFENTDGGPWGGIDAGAAGGPLRADLRVLPHGPN
jgi:hypothetical protein